MRWMLSQAVLAIAVILALPVSQLRLVTVLVECCCPDPEHCHCPDHAPEDGGPTMQQCHKSAETCESPAPASAAPASVAIASTPVRTAAPVHHVLRTPHEPPNADRPRGPS